MALIRKIEQVSFKDPHTGNYLDVVVCDGYIEISINDSKEEKISLELEDWKSLDKEIRKIFKELKDEKSNNSGK